MVEEASVSALGSILPEILVLIGGLLILVLDMVQEKNKDTGRGYMAITVLFLFIGLVGVILLMGAEAYTALSVIDIDAFSTFFKLIIFVGMILVAIAGGGHMNRQLTDRGEFWALFMFVTLSMSIAVSANNLLLLFLAIESLSITSYILTGIVREDNRSSEAGLKYFLYGSVASSVMLYGMSLLYGASGSLYLVEIATSLANADELLRVVAVPAILLMLVGFGFKTSIAPFFQWAPDTYDGAPTPITAYLSTASKAVGFAVTARVFIVALGGFRHEWVPILAGLSILTMTIGNLIALRQSSVKRMLAYSSVAQAGYIMMGLVAVVAAGGGVDLETLGMNGLNGVLIYLFAYLFTNIGAFMVVLAIEELTGSSELDAYTGLMRRAPGLAIAMLIFLLSLTGIPATGGFMGKFYVFGAAVQHQYYYLAVAGFINAGIAAGYYLRVVGAMFFAGDDEEARPVPVGVPIQITVVVCVIATIWIGLYPPNFIDWANDASRQLLALTF